MITVQLARALNDKRAREIIYQNTPTWQKGEVRLAELAIDNPHLLTVLSGGFIKAVEQKEISGTLADLVHESLYDETSLLTVFKAMFDLEITLVNPTEGNGWDGLNPIAVLYIPTYENASNVTGVTSSLESISWDAGAGIPPYSFLSINTDEDARIGSSVSHAPVIEQNNTWSFVPSAYANYPDNHPDCYHNYIIYPLVEIEIYHNHEPQEWNNPEIEIEYYYYNNTVDVDRQALPELDDIDSVYTNWQFTEVHGTCNQHWDKLQVWEADDWSSDDNVAYWRDINLQRGNYQVLRRNDADSDEKDAQVKIIESNKHW